jgi:DNA polymerase-4
LPCVQDDFAVLAGLDALWVRAKAEIDRKARIVRVHVTLADLSPANARQLDMFYNDDGQRRKCEKITNAIDHLNLKFGQRVVTIGPWTSPGEHLGAKIAYNRIPSAEDFI